MKMNSIQIGVCGWGDHDLYPPGIPAREKLSIYASHFPVVELDSSFYAIPPIERVERWVDDTPDSFRFVVKAYRELTGHGQPKGAPVRTWKQMVDEMIESVEPFVQSGKLSMLLFQFPPWYDCNKKHVQYIRRVREAFGDLPVAIEFRHQSWFYPEYHDKTLSFLERENLIHVICDEPQVPEGSIPLVLSTTHSDHVLVRFHGRNKEGWSASGNPNWRDVRYAYRYSDKELLEWVNRVKWLKEQVNEVTLLFNNNSEGDAADNAKRMIQLLGIEYEGLHPRQLEFF